MSKHEFDDREWQAQERALAEEKDRAVPGSDARVNRYRAAFQAVQQAARVPPPLDFVAGVLRRAAQFDREDAIERWVLRVVGALVGIGLALYVGPMALDALAAGLRPVAPGLASGVLSSPLLWSALLALGVATFVDQGWSRR
ncbi:MAG: hypothetical protein IPK27_18225 [Rhodanobacteraceae bacterium]|nr:hypothetical protein [Rhodanobacteraceae bacterium]